MDRPIIFSAPMVRALLAGRKTQTRRLLKPLGDNTHLQCTGRGDWFWWTPDVNRAHVLQRIPYAPGDRLYVREAHALVPSSAYRFSPGVPYAVSDEDGSQACVYREGWERSQPGTGWRPSIHMPRWASRITLTVTEVRVQRLQEIDEADARAEGAPALGAELCPPDCEDIRSHVWGFHDLWESLHGPDAWDANPWVVAVTFSTERRNIADI